MSKELLTPALRQYRHNNSEGFLFAYEKEETEAVITELQKQIERLEKGLIDFKSRYQFSPWIQKQVDEAING